jgi:tetraacyldisaccharide-1-P 4'-kinase
MQRRTGDDVLGIQECTLVRDQQLVDLDTTRRPMLHGHCIPHNLLHLRRPDFQELKASTTLHLRLRCRDASQVPCKLMLRRAHSLITHPWSTRLTEVTINEQAFLGKSTA